MKLRKIDGTIWLIAFVLGGMLFLNSCGSNKAPSSKSRHQYTQTKQLLESKTFEIENDWAYPLAAGNINLIGNSNYIRFKNDSVKLFLPYFGTRYFGGYGSEGGIKYEGIPEELELTEQENNRFKLSFKGKQDNENLFFQIDIFSNGNTYTTVNSSQRSTISYRGKMRELPDDKN